MCLDGEYDLSITWQTLQLQAGCNTSRRPVCTASWNFNRFDNRPANIERMEFLNWIPRRRSPVNTSMVWKICSMQRVTTIIELSRSGLDEREVYDITVDEHRFLLADGVFVHNSVDDDPATAMRYTETKMSVIA
jgi:hypothetical protein